MKVGDLVKCLVIDDRVGIVVELLLHTNGHPSYYRVMVTDDQWSIWPFQGHQLDVISEGR